VVGDNGVFGSLLCLGGPKDTGLKVLVGVPMPDLLGVDDVLGENVGVVGRDLIDVPNATVGVVERGVNICSRRLGVDDRAVGVLRPDRLDEEVLRRFVWFRLLVDPKFSEGASDKVRLLARLTIEEVILLRLRDESLLPDEFDEA
jgi:hypothetical protein